MHLHTCFSFVEHFSRCTTVMFFIRRYIKSQCLNHTLRLQTGREPVCDFVVQIPVKRKNGPRPDCNLTVPVFYPYVERNIVFL